MRPPMSQAALLALAGPCSVLFWWWWLLPVDGGSGGKWGWRVGPDYCLQSESFRCIHDNPDPRCTEIIPWCSAKQQRRMLDDVSGGKSMGLEMRKLKAYYMRERQLFQQQQRQKLRRRQIQQERRRYKQDKWDNRWISAPRESILPRRRNRPRMIGGDEIYPGAFPWMVRIQHNGETGCSGTLVNNDTILTAAHCLTMTNFHYDNVSVWLGQFYIDRNESYAKEVQIDWACMHPYYLPKETDYDVGIIRLRKPVNYTRYIQPICRYSNEQNSRPDYYGNCLAVGYGSIWAYYDNDTVSRPNTEILSKELRYVGLDEQECPYWSEYKNKTVTCLKPWDIYDHDGFATIRMGPCGGDSGGPIACFDPLGKLWYQTAVVVATDHRCGHNRDNYDYAFDLWKFRRVVNKMISLRDHQSSECNILKHD